MFKTLDRFKYVFLISVLVQSGLIISGYFALNLSAQTITGVAAFSAFNIGVLLVFNLLIARGVKIEYISTKWALSFDMGEVLKFAETGMVAYDENLYISWVSDFMSSRGLTNIIGQKIFDWKPDLERLWNRPDGELDLTIENHTYAIRYIKETRTFIFKDVTSYKTLQLTYTDEQKCFGLIVIDNYQEVIKTADEDLKIKIATLTGETISAFSQKYKAFMRSSAPDQYTVLMDYKTFKAAKENQFEIFNDFKNKAAEFKVNISLTVGFSHGHASINHLMDLASSALDLGRARGGDQIVIRAFGQPTQFLGGESEAKFNTSKVAIKAIANEIEGQVESANDIVVMGHQNGDFDCIGAATGLIAIANAQKVPIKWVVDVSRLDVKAKKAFETDIPKDFVDAHVITPQESLKYVNPQTLLFVVDTHIPTRVEQPKLLEMTKKIIVIDHHRKNELAIKDAPVEYVEPSASSTSEIVTEIMEYQNKLFKKKQHILNMLLTGIVLDTNHYRMRTSTRTYEASATLKRWGADPVVADELLKDTAAETQLKGTIISSMEEIIPGIVIAEAPETQKIQQSVLAQVAQQILQIKGTKACIVIGLSQGGHVAVSIRTDGTVNGQIIAEEMGGGGHLTAAGAQIPDSNIQEIRERIVSIIKTGKTDFTVQK